MSIYVVVQERSNKDGQRRKPPAQRNDDNVGDVWLHVQIGEEELRARSQMEGVVSGLDAGGSQPMKVFESAAHGECSFVVGDFSWIFAAGAR